MTDNPPSDMSATVAPAGGPSATTPGGVHGSVRPRALTPTSNPFDTAPFYRKRWVLVVSALIFIPLTLVILLTGPVYQGDGVVWDQKKRVTTAIALCVVMAFTFVRLGAM